MNLSDLMLHSLSFAAIFPGILICLLPVAKYIRFPIQKLLCAILPLFSLLCILLGYLCECYDFSNNLFFVPVMLSCLAAYFSAVNLPRFKLFYLFLCAVAILSFGSLANFVVCAMLHPYDDPNKPFLSGLIAQNCLVLVFLLIFFLIRKKITWQLENFHSKFVWRLVWFVPVIIIFCNFMMIPAVPANMTVGRLFWIYLAIDISLFLFFVIFQVMFYKTAVDASKRYRLEKASLLYQTQISQYESLNEHIEQSVRMRHDFRHIMTTIYSLSKSEQYDKLNEYIGEYSINSTDSTFSHFFCQNSVINALLSYYADIADAHHISVCFQIQTPDSSILSDIDLSILFGNLLDNAISACKEIPEPNRYINLTADTETPGSFYIVMANGFNGKLDEQNGRFLSTKTDGSSIGLSSIQAIAEKYHGIAKFHAAGNEFISNVMLKL